MILCYLNERHAPRRPILLALVAGLAVLTLVGYFALSRTIRDWFVGPRHAPQLAVSAAPHTLADTGRATKSG
jgi:hypothetical protein